MLTEVHVPDRVSNNIAVDLGSTAPLTDDVMLKMPPKFIRSARIQQLLERSQALAISGKRKLGWGDSTVGDHACWIHIGPFPHLDQMPSRVNGYAATGESWGRDYAFLVSQFPVEIHPNERIVGEIHWEMHMVRQYEWPDSVREMGMWAAGLGAGGYSSLRTCPDLEIGLTHGWGGIQINLNIMDLKKLRDAMDHPENPEYQNIIVRVTGYASRFICLTRPYQQEFVERMNYEGF